MSDGCTKDLGEAGYLHFLNKLPPGKRYTLPRFEPRVPAKAIDAPPPDWITIIDGYRKAMTEQALQIASGILGVSEDSLVRLGIGLAGPSAWSFPMSDYASEPVGIRIRKSDGKKWAFKGSRNGLFIPTGINGKDPLIICEGPTDTAAALDLGFEAIGRPNCNGAVEWCIDFARGRTVAIFADNDGPGLDGANKLAEWLVRQGQHCKVLVSPYHKDLREWKRDGLMPSGLNQLISTAAWWRPVE